MEPGSQKSVRHLIAPEEFREESQNMDSFTESPQPAVTRESPGPQLPSPKQVPEIFPSQGLHLMSPQLSPVPVRRRARETEDHPGGWGL